MAPKVTDSEMHRMILYIRKNPHLTPTEFSRYFFRSITVVEEAIERSGIRTKRRGTRPKVAVPPVHVTDDAERAKLMARWRFEDEPNIPRRDGERLSWR